MQKMNYDAKRAQALKQIHADKVKAAAEKKKADEKAAAEAAKAATKEQNIVSDAKID